MNNAITNKIDKLIEEARVAYESLLEISSAVLDNAEKRRTQNNKKLGYFAKGRNPSPSTEVNGQITKATNKNMNTFGKDNNLNGGEKKDFNKLINMHELDELKTARSGEVVRRGDGHTSSTHILGNERNIRLAAEDDSLKKAAKVVQGFRNENRNSFKDKHKSEATEWKRYLPVNVNGDQPWGDFNSGMRLNRRAKKAMFEKEKQVLFSDHVQPVLDSYGNLTTDNQKNKIMAMDKTKYDRLKKLRDDRYENETEDKIPRIDDSISYRYNMERRNDPIKLKEFHDNSFKLNKK